MTDDEVRRYFSSRWAGADRAAAAALLATVDTAFRRVGIDYFLYAGTLLGHVRCGRLLDWDDDIDVVTVGPQSRDAVAAALAGDPVTVGAHPFRGVHKVYPTASRPRSDRPWSYPFVDVAAGVVDGETFWHNSVHGGRDVFRLSSVLPTRRARIEGIDVSVPYDPAAVCVAKYGPACLSSALPPAWDHAAERPTGFPAERVPLARIAACLTPAPGAA